MAITSERHHFDAILLTRPHVPLALLPTLPLQSTTTLLEMALRHYTFP
jgi:hypothetical protein